MTPAGGIGGDQRLDGRLDEDFAAWFFSQRERQLMLGLRELASGTVPSISVLNATERRHHRQLRTPTSNTSTNEALHLLAGTVRRAILDEHSYTPINCVPSTTSSSASFFVPVPGPPPMPPPPPPVLPLINGVVTRPLRRAPSDSRRSSSQVVSAHRRPSSSTAAEPSHSSSLYQQQMFIERLVNKRATLLDFTSRLFCYQNLDDEHRRECNKFLINCPFLHDGPHRPIRLNLAASTIVLSLLEHGFVVESRARSLAHLAAVTTVSTDRSRFADEVKLTACATYVSCRYCRSRLFNVHMLNLLLAQRFDLLFYLLQHQPDLVVNGDVSIAMLYQYYTERTVAPLRARLQHVLRRAHRSDCLYADAVMYPDLLDPLTANRTVNEHLCNRCESCLIGLIEHDLQVNVETRRQLREARQDNLPDQEAPKDSTATATDGGMHDDENDDAVKNNDGGGITNTTRLVDHSFQCRCCLTRRARVNVPCGHLFQCRQCELLLGRSGSNGDGWNGGPLRLPPCAVCRAPVFLSVEVFDC